MIRCAYCLGTHNSKAEIEACAAERWEVWTKRVAMDREDDQYAEDELQDCADGAPEFFNPQL